MTLDGEVASVERGAAPSAWTAGPVLLRAAGDTYLAQVAAHLAKLDDAGAEVWLEHPDGPWAFRVVLRDEAAFRAWLDEPVPGKVRVLQREDGFELTTNIGKLHGFDPNGPTVPLRDGQLDVATLQRGLERVRGRFPAAPDLCVAPAYGIELAQVARALAANFHAPDAPIFPVLCLVYPRPDPALGRDSGAAATPGSSP